MTTSVELREEQEVTFSRHCELLESLDDYRFSLARRQVGGNPQDLEPEDVHDGVESSTDNDDTNEETDRVVPRKQGRRRRTSRCLCWSTLLFLAGVGAGLFFIWRFGLSNPFRRNQEAVAQRVESAGETYISVQPSQAPSSARPSISPQPTTSPSFNPTMKPSMLPSVSPKPSITPQPSGSFLPSGLPSLSFLPTSPTAYPSSEISALPSALPSETPRICNGLASNCNRRANQIMYATVHNAMSSQEDGFLGFNNLLPLEDALDAGFRALLVDSCDCNDSGILMCHSVCVAGTRDPTVVFDNIVQFMNQHPHDILIIELQITDQSLGGLWESTTQEFRDLLYSHWGNTVPWPTLNELIDMGKRIIVFQHNGPNCDAKGSCPEGVHNLFTFAFETNWDLEGVDDLMNFDLSCKIINGEAWLPNNFMLNNHFAGGFFGLPSRDVAEEINTYDTLQTRIEACTRVAGRRTNLLAVDFWSIGDVVAVVNDYNAKLEDNIFDE